MHRRANPNQFRMWVIQDITITRIVLRTGRPTPAVHGVCPDAPANYCSGQTCSYRKPPRPVNSIETL